MTAVVWFKNMEQKWVRIKKEKEKEPVLIVCIFIFDENLWSLMCVDGWNGRERTLWLAVRKKYRIESDKSSGFETSKGIQLVTWSWLQNSNFPFLDKHQYAQNWNFYQISSLSSLNWRSWMFLVFSQVIFLVWNPIVFF